MKIVVLTGSPHKVGTSSLLADSFIDGAKEAGHEIYRFDAAFEKVHPCIACDKCKCGENPCVFQDSMTKLFPQLREADMIAFVTPLYFYGPSSQIKAVIDRFYGINNLLRGTDKKAVLLVSGTNNRDWAMHGIVGNYTEALQYLRWQDCGKVLAKSCRTREDIEKTDYPEQAYQLGKMV
ncbi:MAG: multimeric flavodoxin WrbA family protein [Firmicutes bacterium]|nr:multimeric flavodoxin WrbA family protein [Bacillota bacterium]